MVFVALVMPVAKPVRSGGAAAAAVAGRAATRAPEPRPATAMLISACQVSSWKAATARSPIATSTDDVTSALRGPSSRAVSGRVKAPIARKMT